MTHMQELAKEWLENCSDHRGEQILSLAELLEKQLLDARKEAEEQRDRYWMWSSHGHLELYGDDGEMQCAQCGVDYKRAALKKVQIAYYAAHTAESRQRSASWHWRSRCSMK